MLYVKDAKFIIDDSYNERPKYNYIVIADFKTRHVKRISIVKFRQLFMADTDWIKEIVGVYYDVIHDYFTFTEVDPDDWEKYHECYESTDNTPDPASTANRFYGGFSMFNLTFNVGVRYGSISNESMGCTVYDKGTYKNFVRLEKGFVIYNDDLYMRKSKDCEEIFWVGDHIYTHSAVFHKDLMNTKKLVSYQDIEGISSVKDFAFACKHRVSEEENTIESYFLVNNKELVDMIFNTKFGWSAAVDSDGYDCMPHEIAVLDYGNTSFSVVEKVNGYSRYIRLYSSNGVDACLDLCYPRVRFTSSPPIMIADNNTLIKLIQGGTYYVECRDNKLYFANSDDKYKYQVLELEIVDGYGFIRCVPRFKHIQMGIYYDFLEGKPTSDVDVDAQQEVFDSSILGNFNSEDYKAYIQSQAPYIKREGLKCKLASSECNVWVLREIDRLPATNVYFKIKPCEEGWGTTLCISKDGQNYIDVIDDDCCDYATQSRMRNGKSYLALRSDRHGEISVGIAFVSEDEFVFYKLENIFDMVGCNEESWGIIETHMVLNNNDILKELDNGYIRGNLL